LAAPSQSYLLFMHRVGSTAASPEAAARRRSWQALETSLQARLDPIDWATYEPYLGANVAGFCGRSGVLLGSLLQLARPPAAEVRILTSTF